MKYKTDAASSEWKSGSDLASLARAASELSPNAAIFMHLARAIHSPGARSMHAARNPKTLVQHARTLLVHVLVSM